MTMRKVLDLRVCLSKHVAMIGTETFFQEQISMQNKIELTLTRVNNSGAVSLKRN